MSNDKEPKRIILFFKGNARDLKSFWSKLQGFDQKTNNADPTEAQILTDPSSNLSFSQKVVSPTPERVPSPPPLREEYEVAVLGRRNRSERDRPRRGSDNPHTEHKRPIHHRRSRFEIQNYVLPAIASVLILTGAYAQRDEIMKTTGSAVQRVADGMTNPPGLQVARRIYSQNQAYLNLKEQLDAQRKATEVDSGAIRLALDRQQIKDQIKFLITFAEGIDKTHGNNSAGDSHRKEAARLQALLDK